MTAITIRDFNTNVHLQTDKVYINNRFKLQDGIISTFEFKNGLITPVYEQPKDYYYPLTGTLSQAHQGGYDISDFHDNPFKMPLVRLYRGLYWIFYTIPFNALTVAWYDGKQLVFEAITIVKLTLVSMPLWILDHVLLQPLKFIFWDVGYQRLIRPITDDIIDSVLHDSIPLIRRLFGDIWGALVDWIDMYVKSGEVTRDIANMQTEVNRLVEQHNLPSPLAMIVQFVVDAPFFLGRLGTQGGTWFKNVFNVFVDLTNKIGVDINENINNVTKTIGAGADTLIKTIWEFFGKIVEFLAGVIP